MKVIACYSIKGGVGKTAAAVNLAYLASISGRRTLLWDLDPQGAASFYLRVEPKVKGGGKGLVKGKRDPSEAIKGSDFEGLDLLPADFSYRHLDLRLDAAKKPRKRIGRLVAPLAEEYDLLFIDCAPSISLVSESVFRASDALLVPVIPTTLSRRTLDQLGDHLAREGLESLDLMPFVSMVDRRKKLHREISEAAIGGAGDGGRFRYLETPIPYSTWVERMGLERAPVALFAPRSAPATAYLELWREIERRLG